MDNLQKLIRPNILSLKAYSSARDEYSGKDGIFLDANENPFGELNRYPDPYQQKMKTKLAEMKQLNPSQIFIGNGSDEVMDLAFRIFCEPRKDKALSFLPSYGMYEVSAALNNVELIKVPLTASFQLDLEKLEPYLRDENLKLLFICSPNNPSGNVMKQEDVQYILEKFFGIVIIDEAYIDFANSPSLISLLDSYKNLIVSQTLSKAWGLAGARVGMAFANEEIIRFFNKTKPPYNVSELNQKAALKALSEPEIFEQRIQQILEGKKLLEKELSKLSLVKKIYPSDANFLLIEVDDANSVYEDLLTQKIVIRNRDQQVKNCVRITVGTPAENQRLLNTLKKLKS